MPFDTPLQGTLTLPGGATTGQKRIVLDGTTGIINFYSGDVNETAPGELTITVAAVAPGEYPRVDLAPPRFTNQHAAHLVLVGTAADGTVPAQAAIMDENDVQWINVQAGVTLVPHELDLGGALQLNVSDSGTIHLGNPPAPSGMISTLITDDARRGIEFWRHSATQGGAFIDCMTSIAEGGTLLFSVDPAGNIVGNALSVNNPPNNGARIAIQAGNNDRGLDITAGNAPAGALLVINNNANAPMWYIGNDFLPNWSASLVTGVASPGGIAPPATVAGYAKIRVNGALQKVPYYS